MIKTLRIPSLQLLTTEAGESILNPLDGTFMAEPTGVALAPKDPRPKMSDLLYVNEFGLTPDEADKADEAEEIWMNGVVVAPHCHAEDGAERPWIARCQVGQATY